MTTGDKKPKQESAELAPLKQIKEGITPKDIQCKSTMELIFSRWKSNSI